MRTNSILTYILYVLLFGLISLAGWKACEMKKEKAAQAREQAELSKDLGYIGEEEVGSTASVYRDSTLEKPTSTAIPAPAPSSYGIEGEVGSTTSTPTTASTPTKRPPVVARTDDDEPFRTTAKPAKKSLERDIDNDDKKYIVIAGSFKQMANARKQMEELVKKGFRNAEVGKMNRGAFGVAIADRTDSKKTANDVLAKLKTKGFKDARIISKK